MKAKLYMLTLIACLLACGGDPVDPPAFRDAGQVAALARFALSETHLYAVDEQSFNIYRVLHSGDLVFVKNQYLGIEIETISVKSDMLYIGAPNAMWIFDITDPEAPKKRSNYSQIAACDPMVVQDTLAFVIYNADNCRMWGRNELEVLNIKDPERSVQVASYSLTSPKAIGAEGTLLFVCEGTNGLKIFDISNPYRPKIVAAYGFPAEDIAVTKNGIIITNSSGVGQYSYNASGQLQQLSFIPVTLID